MYIGIQYWDSVLITQKKGWLPTSSSSSSWKATTTTTDKYGFVNWFRFILYLLLPPHTPNQHIQHPDEEKEEDDDDDDDDKISSKKKINYIHSWSIGDILFIQYVCVCVCCFVLFVWPSMCNTHIHKPIYVEMKRTIFYFLIKRKNQKKNQTWISMPPGTIV